MVVCVYCHKDLWRCRCHSVHFFLASTYSNVTFRLLKGNSGVLFILSSGYCLRFTRFYSIGGEKIVPFDKFTGTNHWKTVGFCYGLCALRNKVNRSKWPLRYLLNLKLLCKHFLHFFASIAKPALNYSKNFYSKPDERIWFSWLHRKKHDFLIEFKYDKNKTKFRKDDDKCQL